jgi:hypothetical protein
LLGGNWLNPLMVAELNDAVPPAVQQLQIMSVGAEEGAISGSALWLRAEPQDDPEMALAIASDLDRWSATCGA